MSDNVVRPPQWLQNGQQSLVESDPRGDATATVEFGGDGPQGPGMDARVAKLEATADKHTESLNRIEVMLAVMSAKLDSLATKVELTAVAGRLETLTERVHLNGESLSKVETGLRDLNAKVDSKLPGGVAIFTIFGGLIVLMISFTTAILAAARHFNWFGP